MPFVRFNRDEQGYENTFVVHTFRQNGKSHPRILYWFRTPPHVKVGRRAIDEDTARVIERSNPDLKFDWEKIFQSNIGSAAQTANRKRTRKKRPESVQSTQHQKSLKVNDELVVSDTDDSALASLDNRSSESQGMSERSVDVTNVALN